MRQDKRFGLLIVVVAAAAAGIILLISKNWGVPGYQLVLFRDFEYEAFFQQSEYDWEWAKPICYFFSQTRYILALLLVFGTYGLCVFLSLLPLLWFKSKTVEAPLPADA